ncbi:hypothetical protein BLNAU_7263 [Blattamonas nauphoetae]|uniref:Uncharacterized protein n=1 Tax=Blattamonas nauphoetae TaxID=2049346 RepID=A0ABQ9Y296_9EUKA|nr:hypothetical protein BLNAU_7263 [Blattamonas nauphoetae]
MIVPSSTMQEEHPHPLTPNHSIIPNSSDADGRILSERESFLTFDPNSQLSFKDKSAIYCSLIDLLKAEYPFDNALQDKAARFLKNLEPRWSDHDLAAKLVTDLVLSSAGPPSGFVESTVTLLSSPHSNIVAAALSFVYETTRAASHDIRSRLMESDLIAKVLTTVQPQTLPVCGNATIFGKLVNVIIYSLFLVDPAHLNELGLTTAVNQFKHHEIIFQNVVLPSSEFMTFLITNRFVLDVDLLKSFMSLLATLLRIGPFHRPTLEFVIASPIVMAFSSCLSFVEDDLCLWIPITKINYSLFFWTKEGPEVTQSGKRMMQALFSECFEDTLEQMMMRDKDEKFGSRLVDEWQSISQSLGLNMSRQ